MDRALIVAHVVGNIFWIGAIAATVLTMTAKSGDAKTRGELAQQIYLKVAVPGFVLSFVAGVARLALDTGHYFKQPWFHAKLTVALIVIALHHIIGARAKRMAKGDSEDAGPSVTLFIVYAICAALAVFFVIMQIPGGG